MQCTLPIYARYIFFMHNLRIIYLVGFQLQPMRLGKLENLDLSDNELNSSILSILSGLSSLKSLHLSNNMLTGSGMIHSFYLANCFTWHSLNYIVSLSRKMRTLYLCSDQFFHDLNPRPITGNTRASIIKTKNNNP